MLKFWRDSGNCQQFKKFKVKSSHTSAENYYSSAEFQGKKEVDYKRHWARGRFEASIVTIITWDCEWNITSYHAISVKKGCCSHQAITLWLPQQWALRERRIEKGCLPLSSASAVTPQWSPLRRLWMRSTVYWPQTAEVHIKEVTSVSPDSWVFR